MTRTGLFTLLILYLFFLGSARSENARFKDVLTEVRDRTRTVARDVGPSIARILVSRSTAYSNAPHWGEPTQTSQSLGQLGRFDAEAAKKKVPEKAQHRSRILRTIDAHDLSNFHTIPESFGSGFVLDRSGLILTNSHVVRNATKIYVRLSGKRGSWANIHASDPRSDLAVLKLLDPPADLKPVPLGNAASIGEGQFIISLSNPFAPGFRASDAPTVNYGMVNSLRQSAPGKTDEMERSKITLHHYGTLIQADADKTGCSGGALLNLDGKVIGMTTALLGVTSKEQGTLAIPIDSHLKRIIEVLRRGEEVEYGFLGVVLNNRFGDGGFGTGVMLERVSPGSPAARGGLRAGDRIISINDQPIRKNDDLFLYVGMALAGSRARVVVATRGNGTPRTVMVTLAKFYVAGPVIAANQPPARFGLRVDYTSLLAQRGMGIFARWPGDGVIIREVIPKSPADKALLQPDKIITRVNGKAVTTPAEYYKEISQAGKKVELTYLNFEGGADTLTLDEK